MCIKTGAKKGIHERLTECPILWRHCFWARIGPMRLDWIQTVPWTWPTANSSIVGTSVAQRWREYIRPKWHQSPLIQSAMSPSHLSLFQSCSSSVSEEYCLCGAMIRLVPFCGMIFKKCFADLAYMFCSDVFTAEQLTRQKRTVTKLCLIIIADLFQFISDCPLRWRILFSRWSQFDMMGLNQAEFHRTINCSSKKATCTFPVALLIELG